MIEVYKVVARGRGGWFVSAVALGGVELKYPLGEVVRGHPMTIGPLCFERLVDAQLWCSGGEVILRCEAPRVSVRPVLLSFELERLSKVQYGRRKKPPAGFCETVRPPIGTIAVPWLRPLEVIGQAERR